MQKDFFLQIVIDQKAEAKPDLKSADLVFREQTNDLCLILDKPPVKVIMGIRRGGKSTLMLQALSGKQFIYFNFDHELLSQISVKDLSDLFETLYQKIPAAKYFLFDEIQNILGWEFFINKLHRKKLNVLITGSNSHLLSRELATHLTGRHISIELFPFSFNEYLKGQKVELQDLELLPTSQKLFIQNKFTEYLIVDPIV
jgi:predicted AAA+ superfamily ATPase